MKKILIVTYYWPPFSGSGVQRWLKFAKYLPSFNWQPFIYTPKNPYIKSNDFSLMNDIPKDVQIWKTKIWEPYKLRNLFFKKKLPNQSEGIISNQKTYKNRILNWIRGNFFIPDPKVFWVKPSVKFLINKIKENNISHIITTGPPHSMHLIGLMLKEHFPHLKWIVDFRDPWTDYDMLEDFYLTESSTKKHHKLEKCVIQNADVILSVSETWCEKLKKMGASKIYLLTNGYDSSDFTSTKKNNAEYNELFS